MLGWIECTESGSRPRLTRETRLGGTFLVLRISCGEREPRAARAARQMRAQGVRTAVFPAQFPHGALFRRCGIFPADPLPLRRALCTAYVQNRLDAMGRTPERARIAITADHMTDAVEAAVRPLALLYRHVMLSVRFGGDAFVLALRRQHGIALVSGPSRSQLEQADALILFAPRSDLSMQNPILCTLYPGGSSPPLLLGSDLAAQLPPNCSREQAAAVLHSMGLLSLQQLLREISC